jgi:hypothetical protein
MKSTSKGNGIAMPNTQKNLYNKVVVLTLTEQINVRGGKNRGIIEDILSI